MKSALCSLLYDCILRNSTIESEKLIFSKTKIWTNIRPKKEEVLVQIISLDESR